MNIELEISVKVKATDDAPPAEPRRAILAAVLDKIAAHPCVVMILREFVQRS